MQVKTIDLYEYFGVQKPEKAKGILTAYVLGAYEYFEKRIRPAMLVIPGGAYAHVSGREKEPVALAYASKGFNTYTLDYTVGLQHPTQLIEAAMAVAYIKEHAENDCTDIGHIAAVGFSAGGHLTSMLATIYDDECVKKVLGNRDTRLDAVVLSYPVITCGEKGHAGSFYNLCGENNELKELLSTEKRVNEKSVPAFIWSTFQDAAVPCENSLYMASAYRKFGIPFELHIFEHGGHGLSLGTVETSPEFTYIQPWFNLSVSWLQSRGFKLGTKE